MNFILNFSRIHVRILKNHVYLRRNRNSTTFSQMYVKKELQQQAYIDMLNFTVKGCIFAQCKKKLKLWQRKLMKWKRN